MLSTLDARGIGSAGGSPLRCLCCCGAAAASDGKKAVMLPLLLFQAEGGTGGVVCRADLVCGCFDCRIGSCAGRIFLMAIWRPRGPCGPKYTSKSTSSPAAGRPPQITCVQDCRQRV